MARGAVFALVVLCALVGTAAAARHEASTNRLLELARIMSQLQNGEQPTLDEKVVFNFLKQEKANLKTQMQEHDEQVNAKRRELIEDKNRKLAALNKTLENELTAAAQQYNDDIAEQNNALKDAKARVDNTTRKCEATTTAHAAAESKLTLLNTQLDEMKREREEKNLQLQKEYDDFVASENRKYNNAKEDRERTFNREKQVILDAGKTEGEALDNEEKLVEQIRLLLIDWKQNSYPKDCYDAKMKGAKALGEKGTVTGVYEVQPGAERLQVHCDMETDGGGWTYVNEATAGLSSETNIYDLVTDHPLKANRHKYALHGMDYDEVLVERMGPEWCDSWGVTDERANRGKLIGSKSIAIVTDADTVHFYTGAAPFTPEKKGWVSQKRALCESAQAKANCWEPGPLGYDESNIQVSAVDSTEKKVKFTIGLGQSTAGTGAKMLEVSNFNAYLGRTVLPNSKTQCYMANVDSDTADDGFPTFQQRVYIRKGKVA